MKKHLSKLFGLVAAVACLASPLNLMATHNDIITNKSVAGTYEISGFSNSFPSAPLGIEAQAVVGQITLNRDGTGVIPFADFTIVTIVGTVVTQHFVDVQATYTLGPVDGQGSITLFDFPTTGANPVFAVSFKKRCDRVVGFSALITANTTSNLWTLIQAERFN